MIRLRECSDNRLQNEIINMISPNTPMPTQSQLLVMLANASDEIKLLRDRCWKAEGNLARWQKIAIEAKAEAIFWMEQTEPGDDNPEWEEIETDWADAYREQAAKELNLRVTQEAGYVERLEIAFVEEITQALELIGAENPRQTAQAALAKIREGKLCH
jgi:hypothetical protein